MTYLMAMDKLSILTKMSTTESGGPAGKLEEESSKRHQLVKFLECLTGKENYMSLKK